MPEMRALWPPSLKDVIVVVVVKERSAGTYLLGPTIIVFTVCLKSFMNGVQPFHGGVHSVESTDCMFLNVPGNM